MKRFCKISMLSVGAFLVLLTAVALTYPVSASAAWGVATCKNGSTITCTAYKCDCTDGLGCVAYDSKGNDSLLQCPSGKDVAPIEDPPVTE